MWNKYQKKFIICVQKCAFCATSFWVQQSFKSVSYLPWCLWREAWGSRRVGPYSRVRRHTSSAGACGSSLASCGERLAPRWRTPANSWTNGDSIYTWLNIHVICLHSYVYYQINLMKYELKVSSRISCISKRYFIFKLYWMKHILDA